MGAIVNSKIQSKTIFFTTISSSFLTNFTIKNIIEKLFAIEPKLIFFKNKYEDLSSSDFY